MFFGGAEDIARLERIWLSNKPIYSESKSTNKLIKTKIIKETHQHMNYRIDKKDESYEKDFYENKKEYLKSLNNKSRYLHSLKYKREYWKSLKNLKNHCNESRVLLQCHRRCY